MGLSPTAAGATGAPASGAPASAPAPGGRAGGAAVRLGDRVRPYLREKDLGRAGVAIALALLTVLAAMVAGLQSHASTMAQQGRREADRIGLLAAGNDGSSLVRVGTAYGVYRRWYEELERSNWAQNEITRDPERADLALLEQLRDIDDVIAEWATRQSALLQPPYFDAAINNSDFGAFEADLQYGPAVRAAEQRAIEATVAAAWDAKASDYVTVLTVLAVGLFFLGLGATIGRRARRFLSFAGVAFGVAALVWTVAIALGPIHRVPQEAVEKLVESAADQYRAGVTPGAAVEPEARAQFDAAIARADEAVAIDPTYLAAYYNRAEARLFYADALIFSPEGQTQLSNDLLRDAITDYRRFVEGRPDDYGAWWNLGWAAYLQGDVVGSLEATNRAIELAPAQFALYLNRTLALLAGRDEAAALADVRAAIDLAAADSSDSVNWYLGQSDFNIGRLAVLRADHSETLRSIQRELREAHVALRVMGQARPLADAPQLGSVTVRPIEIGRYSGGTSRELSPIEAGSSFEAPEAVGFRITVGGTAALAGRTLSARLWLDGHPRADYRVDVALGATPADETTIELLNPYGRSGRDLDDGGYELQLFVDGATRFTLDWTVIPRPENPLYTMTATQLVDRVKTDGLVCDDPVAEDDLTKVICSATDPDGTQYLLNMFHDDQDRITTVILGAVAEPEDRDVAEVAKFYFGYAFRLLYPADLAERAEAWLGEQGTAVNDVEIGGTTIRVFGATDSIRNLDIWSPWSN